MFAVRLRVNGLSSGDETMNIDKYDECLKITDNQATGRAGEWVAPSEFDIIKEPPTKMQTTDGAPVMTEENKKVILREPAAFVRWAYITYLSRFTAMLYYPFGGVYYKSQTFGSVVSTQNYLYRNLYHPIGTTNYSETVSYLHNQVCKLDTESLYLTRITDAELATLYPDYDNFGDEIVKDSPLKMEHIKGLNERVKLAHDILNGGIGDYVFYWTASPLSNKDKTLIKCQLYDNIKLEKTGSVSKSSTTDSEGHTTVTYTLTQDADVESITHGSSVDSASPLFTIANIPSDFEVTAVVYVEKQYTWRPSWGWSEFVENVPSRTVITTTDTYEFTKTGPFTITNGDVEIEGPLTSMIDKVKEKLGRDFITADSTNWTDKSTSTRTVVVNGSVTFGLFELMMMYSVFLKIKVPI